MPQAVFQPSTTRSPGRDVLDAVPDGLDGARALVTEQDRQPVAPAVLLDDVQVSVADPARLDPHQHLAGPGRVDLDLLETERAGLA